MIIGFDLAAEAGVGKACTIIYTPVFLGSQVVKCRSRASHVYAKPTPDSSNTTSLDIFVRVPKVN